MSCRELRDELFASPVRARSLLTVRAAISFARLVDVPLCFSPSLMCSYWRSRLALHCCRGMRTTPLSLTRGNFPVCEEENRLFERRVLDVVLRGVLVRELVDHVHTVAVGVVDRDERVPLLRQRVLREDRLDRALRFAGAAVGRVHAAGQRERVLLRDNRAERVLGLAREGLNAHHAPKDLARRE